ncbi:MAG: hypothetical protein PVH62_04865 [Anaerolineae bacterium]|jgi:Na+/phosphate symporter
MRQSRRPGGKQIAFGLLGFMLFVFSLGLMKEGAGGLKPLLTGHLRITNTANSMGFGWLMACLVLSGSPVAAAALALLSAGALYPAQAFTMVAGSRLGASFTVLLIGVVYALQGHERRTAVTTGVLSLLLTSSIQLLTLPMGVAVLDRGWLDRISIRALDGLTVTLGRGLDPLVKPLAALLPSYALFLVGIGLVALSFRFFDRALPEIRLERTGFEQTPRLIYRPEVMFLMGLAITLVTMSVSISVGILVPLSARGYMRRENIIPYILGANISTFVDTLVAGVLLGDPRGITVVMTHMICATLISLIIILLVYRPYERVISDALTWIIRGPRNFAIFLGFVFIVPALLILL